MQVAVHEPGAGRFGVEQAHDQRAQPFALTGGQGQVLQRAHRGYRAPVQQLGERDRPGGRVDVSELGEHARGFAFPSGGGVLVQAGAAAVGDREDLRFTVHSSRDAGAASSSCMASSSRGS